MKNNKMWSGKRNGGQKEENKEGNERRDIIK